MSLSKQDIYLRCPAFIQNLIITILGANRSRKNFNTDFKRLLGSLMLSQWYSPAELEELQNEKLCLLIKHAYENVPYYNRIFKERRLSPADIKKTRDLAKLPFLTKKDIRCNFEELKARNFKSWNPKLCHTGGSTGTNLGFYLDRAAHYHIESAFVYRHRSWAGISRFDKRVTLTGLAIKSAKDNNPPFWRYNAGERELIMSSFHLMEKNLPHYLEQLRRYSPEYIFAYPSSLDVLAKYMECNDIYLPVKAIFMSSSNLFEVPRRRIEKYFQAKILDWYGMSEKSVAASECMRREGYHLNSEYGVTEFIKDGRHCRPEELGEIVGTSLSNYSMPLIRYRTGDLGIPTSKRCSCGRGLPLMKSIEGRVDDLIVCPDGRSVPSTAIEGAMEHLDGVRQYQVIQEDERTVTVRVVGKENVALPPFDLIKEGLRNRIGDEFDIKIYEVEKIDLTPSGKHRSVISKVPKGWEVSVASPKKKKILILGPRPPAVGGVAANIDLLLNSSLNKRFTLLTFDPSTQTPKGRNLFLKFMYKFQTLLKYRQVIKREKPDLIHIFASSGADFWIKSVFLLYAKALGRKVILREGGGNFKGFYNDGTAFKRWLIRLSLNLSDKLIVLSSGWKSFFMNIVPGGKMEVVPNGVRFSDYNAHISPDKNIGHLNGKRIILFFGTLCKDKGIYDVIKAMAFVPERQKNFAFVFAGEAETPEKMEDIVNMCGKWIEQGRAHFLGNICGEKKSSLLKTSNIFILPSYIEGFPNVVLEAMAAGLPVVTTNVGAIPEFVAEGENGFVIRPGDYKKLGERINFLLDNPDFCSKVGDNNRRKIKNEYDYELVAQRLGKIYDKVVN